MLREACIQVLVVLECVWSYYVLTLSSADLKAGNIMCNLPEATSEETIRALLNADPPRRYPPEPSWNGPVETAVSQPVPPLPLEKALSASFMISDFGSGEPSNSCDLLNNSDHLRVPRWQPNWLISR